MAHSDGFCLKSCGGEQFSQRSSRPDWRKRREASDSAWSKTARGMPASLWTDTVTGGSWITGTLDQTVGHRRVRATPNQSDFRSVFWNITNTSKVEARIG